MYTSHHDLPALFAQLGLPDDPDSITRFIAVHALGPGEHVAKAACWTASQSRFLRDALVQDAEWVEAVDLLASLMTRH